MELVWGIAILSLSLLGIILIIVGVLNKKEGGGGGGGGSGDDTDSPDLLSQPESTYQFVNATSESYLHIFLANPDLKSTQWVLKSGDGKLGDPLDWTINGGGNSWAPLGSHIAQELIIPKGKYAILQMPSSGMNNVLGVKFKDPDNNNFLTLDQGLPNKITTYVDTAQWPILLEGQRDVIADSSAVDGTNFNIEYSFTECTKETASMDGSLCPPPEAFPINGVPEDGIMYTKTIGNACKGIENDDNSANPDLGCRNPGKWITEACKNHADTGYCEPNTQNCAISACGETLFDLNTEEGKKVAQYDCTGTTWEDCNLDDGSIVKPFLNQAYNLNPDSDLLKFCTAINGEGNFTTYCYDYNDPSSSFTLRWPYKAKIVYKDL
jgi:hypothetical protein